MDQRGENTMSTLKQVMAALKSKGSEQTRKIFRRHGADGDIFGVKVADLKLIAKTIKGDQDLALELYKSGNYDAMYLAGIVADGKRMTRKQLQSWATGAD
jgi:3-methyladenine DNA glycosylase AlkD